MTRKRKTQKNNVQEKEEVDAEKGKNGFFACYLLTSLCPRSKGHTYIGFTVNPRRRIRQHNGELRSGAWRTKKRRPWEMVLCIYGFPTNVAALQFEWAWQHPMESVAVRQAAAAFKSFSGVANKIKLAYTMLNLPAWQSLNITVNYFSTKYKVHSAGCPSLPKNMKVQICPMEELPCYCNSSEILFEDEEGEDDAWDGDEEFEKAANGSGAVEANSLELEASLIDELPCHNGREGSILFECGYDETEYRGACNQSEHVKEKYSKSGDTRGTAKETDADSVSCSSADFAHSIDRSFEENGQQNQRDPPSPEVDHAQPFHFMNSLARRASSMNSLARKSSSIATRLSMSETGDRDVSTLRDENASKLDWQKRENLTSTIVIDDDDDEASNTSAAGKEIHADENTSADYAHSIDKASNEQYGRHGERNPSSPEQDHAQPSGFMNPPARITYSSVTNYFVTETKDGNVRSLCEENVSGVKFPRRKISRVIAHKDDQLTRSSFISPEIEVIDLLSPSPECGIKSGSKKRRVVSPLHPLVIDLT